MQKCQKGITVSLVLGSVSDKEKNTTVHRKVKGENGCGLFAADAQANEFLYSSKLFRKVLEFRLF